jgi:hypothetical protein
VITQSWLPAIRHVFTEERIVGIPKEAGYFLSSMFCMHLEQVPPGSEVAINSKEVKPFRKGWWLKIRKGKKVKLSLCLNN